MLKELITKQRMRIFAVLYVLMTSTMMLWAQEMNEKYSATTQMFLTELKEKAEAPKAKPRRAPQFKLSDRAIRQQTDRLLASPDTVGGVVYISCFIHLKDVGSLNEIRSLGVEIEETSEELGLVTARTSVYDLQGRRVSQPAKGLYILNGKKVNRK